MIDSDSFFLAITPQSMQIPQMPFYYPINALNIPGASVAAGVGPSQNIMISSAGTSGGPASQVPPPLYYTSGVYQGIYFKRKNKLVS